MQKNVYLFLKETKISSSNFRRSGINFDLNNHENTKILINSYRSLNGIKEFMFKYLNELEIKVKNYRIKQTKSVQEKPETYIEK